jgi:site-specific DNA recombinase
LRRLCLLKIPDLTGKRGVFYGRHSTDHQEMKSQEDSAKQFALKYNCHIEFDKYIDPAKSGDDLSKRKGMLALIEDADQGLFDFVVTYHRDRLTRDPLHGQIIRTSMSLQKVPIYITIDESVYDTGDLMIHFVQDGISKYELQKIRKNTKNAIQSLARSGDWVGGKAPFGYMYESDTGNLKQTEDAYLVERIFKEYTQHEGFSSIAKNLPPGTRKGKNWTKSHVKAVITSPFYAGYISIYRTNEHSRVEMDRGKWIMGKSIIIQPIITIEEWEYCWEIYRKKVMKEITPKHYKTSLFLNGIIVCAFADCNQNKLKTLNKQSYSKKGKPYGKRIYFCDICNNMVDAERIHPIVIQKINQELSKINSDQLVKALKNNIQHECSKLETEKYHLELNVIKLENQVIKLNKTSEGIFRETEEGSNTFTSLSENQESMIRIIKNSINDTSVRIDSLYEQINTISKRLKYLRTIEDSEQVSLARLVDIKKMDESNLKKLVLPVQTLHSCL